jgi:hypothetical protein
MENISFIGVVRAKKARQENPPMILLKTRNPRLKPSSVTARLNIPGSNRGAPVPKKNAMKMNVKNPKKKGMVRNFR